MNKKTILLIIFAFIVSASVFLLGYTKKANPKTAYKVYLEGKEIGLISSKEELEAYIDQEQNEIKDQYNVEKVYLPNNLDIEKTITYSNKISEVSDIYEKIKDIAPFTISGYEIKIKGVEEISDEGVSTTKTIKLYILDKNLLSESIEDTIKAFINEEDYEAFKTNTQKEIKTVGSIIENIYIKNDISIKKANISVEEEIFTSKELLSKFLLFGTLEDQKTYKVKKGETIETIAYNHKMSTNEFLVANPSITSANNLLYNGQVVNIGLINPAFKVVEENYVVEYHKIDYNTIYEYDNNLPKGTEKVKQTGIDGKAKMSYNIVKHNGEVIKSEEQSVETIKEPRDKIVIKGNKVISTVGQPASGVWFWPTQKPYTLSSPYGYRWGKLHSGTDICQKRNSKIFAANNGVVAESAYTSYNGNYIIINHNNGWYTTYGHLSKRLVSKGQTVEMGQVIGLMGDTGFVTGVHLHFSVWKGYPFVGGVSMNPMTTLKFK